MTKFIKHTAFLLAMMLTLLAPINALADYYSEWLAYQIGETECINKSCGFLGWYDQTFVQHVLYRRNVMEPNGNTHYEYEWRDTKINCCDN